MAEFDYGDQRAIAERGDETYAKPVGAVYPTFFVGVGGCGCNIVQRIYNMLSVRPDFKERYDKLVQFVAIDTDMDDLKELSLKYKFLISDFPKGEYVKVKTGKEYKEADPFFMQWWPEWYAGRPDSTKGAGQIRVESRLSLYYQLEDDRGGLIEQFNDAVVRSKDHDNPYRVVRPPLAYCHIFCSVAGGTGSGGVLTLAYLFRELLESHKLSPVMVGHLLLPTLFYRKVRSRLHNDIKSNGYATLKELEWFMTLGYNNNPRQMRGDIDKPQDDALEYNYNPNRKPEKGNTRVTMPPFHLVNIIDEPGDFSFAEPKDIYPAIAGTAYVQLFSPIIGQRESEEDNYYKKIKHLEGGFSLNYGTYGLSMLVLPDRDILNYCENVMMKGLLAAMGGGKEGLRDSDFLQRIVAAARSEILACEKTKADVQKKQAVRALMHAGILEEVFKDSPKELGIVNEGWGNAVRPTGLFKLLAGFVDKRMGLLDDEMGSLGLDTQLTDDVLPEKSDNSKETLQRGLRQLGDRLRKRVRDSQANLREAVGVTEKDLEGVARALDDCRFEGVLAGPMVRRLALVYAAGWLGKMRDAEGGKDEIGDPVPQKTAFDTRVEDLHGKYKVDWWERFFGNKDWDKCRTEDIPTFWRNELAPVKPKLRELQRREVLSAVQGWVGQQVEQQKELAPLVGEIASELDEKLAKALSASGGMSDEYVLDDEVFRGVRTRMRHWERLWGWLVKKKIPGLDVKDETTDVGFEAVERGGAEVIEAKVTTAVQLQALLQEGLTNLRGEYARAGGVGEHSKVPSATKEKAEVERIARQFCRKRLVGVILGRRQAGDNRDDKGLMIDECLELEARWELEELYIQDYFANFEKSVHGGVALLSPEEKQKLRAELINKFEPTEANIREYIREKICFVADKARCLGRMRLTETTAVDPFTFICMHNKHYAEEKKLMPGASGGTSLWDFVREAHLRFRTARPLDGWTDEKRIAFFTGQAGLPVHNFWPVNGELKAAYEHIYREYVTGNDPGRPPVRDFPSHVDRNFEDPCNWDAHAILPDLEPGRTIQRRERGVKHFMELVAYDVAKALDGAAWDKGGKGARGAEASFKEAKESDHVKDPREARLAGEEGWDYWVADAAALPTPKGADPVVNPGRPAFVEVLADRLDRAFDRYHNVLCQTKSKKAKVEHVEELLDRRKREKLAAEDPEQFKRGLTQLIERLRRTQGELAAKLEQGHRVGKYADFIDEALASLVEIYEEYKNAGTGE